MQVDNNRIAPSPITTSRTTAADASSSVAPAANDIQETSSDSIAAPTPTRQTSDIALLQLNADSGVDVRAAQLQGQVQPRDLGSSSSSGVSLASAATQNAEIARLEQKYDVDITRLDNGKFRIHARPEGNSKSDTGYYVRVQPLNISRADVDTAQLLEDQKTVVSKSRPVVDQYNRDNPGNPIATRSVSDPIAQRDADVASVRALAERTGFADTPLNRVAVVAASARTGFAVPAEVFDEDPFFGGAGAGAKLAPNGGPGGDLSKIGIAHDTDWFLGYAMGEGPLAKLNTFRQLSPPEIASGLHGLRSSRLISNIVGREALANYNNQLDRYPDLRQLPNYDGVQDAQGWVVTFHLQGGGGRRPSR